MTEEDRLIARALRYAREGERLSAAFVAEIRRVLKASERELAQLVIRATEGSKSAAALAQRAILMRAQVRAILKANGYDVVVASATQAAAEAIVKVALTARERRIIRAFQVSGQSQIEALRQLLALDLLEQGDIAATQIWRALAQQVFGVRPTAELVKELARILDRTEASVQNLFDTQVSIFTRTVEDIATGSLGPKQPYLYVGPADEITREFCIEHVGTVMTREVIDKLDNGQLANPFLTGGGWNCRHVFQAVESKELRAMANTGRRIEGVRGDIERAERAKAARRAASKRKRKSAA